MRLCLPPATEGTSGRRTRDLRRRHGGRARPHRGYRSCRQTVRWRRARGWFVRGAGPATAWASLLPSVAVAALLAAGSGCGPRTQDPPEPQGTSTSTTTDAPEGSTDSDGGSGPVLPPPDCEPPLVACGQECVDLSYHHAHCGRCDNYCGVEGALYGRCYEGRCTSTVSGCVGWEAKEEFGPTCTEVCANFGMECEDRPEAVPYFGAGGCPAGYHYYMELPDYLYDPEGRDSCSVRVGGGGDFHTAPCSEPIIWDRSSPSTNKVQTDIRCCCKQEW